MPHLQSVADDISFIKAMYTDQFNHAPAQLLLHTGSARRAKYGYVGNVWFGLRKSELTGIYGAYFWWKNPDGGKALWGSGFYLRCTKAFNVVIRVSQFYTFPTQQE
jgi:hypothetical protein